MFGGIIKCERLIVVSNAFHKVSGVSQGTGHKAMPDHDWARSGLLLGERQKLRSKFSQSLTVERDKIRGPEAVEDGK